MNALRIIGATEVVEPTEDQAAAGALTLPIAHEAGGWKLSRWEPTPGEIIRLLAGAVIEVWQHGKALIVEVADFVDELDQAPYGKVEEKVKATRTKVPR